jgi:cobalamin synthase
MQTAHRWPQAKTTRFVTMARAWPGISRCTPWTISNTRTCIGQDHAAKELVDDVDAFREATPATPAAAYAMAAIPARYAVERRDWVLAANLSLPSATMSWSSFPWTKAMISYARALGAARTGDVAGARMEIEQLQSAHDALVATSTGPIKSRSSVWRRLPCSRTHRVGMRTR